MKPSILSICFDEEEINKHKNKLQRRAFLKNENTETNYFRENKSHW